MVSYLVVGQTVLPGLAADTVSYDILVRLLVTFGIGILIGLEREFSRENDEQLFAGIRTYPIIALWGFLAALLSEPFSPWVFIGSGMGLLLLVGISYAITARSGSVGGTSELSVVVAFLLGGLAYTGQVTLAIGIAVAVTALLSLKLQFHSFIGKLSRKDISALLKFIVITVLILPFLPDEPVGPYPFLVPRDIWLVVVLVASVGFAGYVLAKFIGARRSIVLTGLIGSLVSSTAVTMDFSRRSKEASSGAGRDYAAGIVLASSTMFLRVLVLMFLLNRELFFQLLPALAACAAAGALAGIVILRSSVADGETTATGVAVDNPLDIIGALKFGAVYLAILFFVHFISDYAGRQGVYLAGAVSGMTDVDAISISMSKLSGASIERSTAEITVIIATLSNSVVKYGMSLLWGSPLLRRYTSIGFGAIVAAGAAALGIAAL